MNKVTWKSPVCKISKKPYKIILLALNCQTTLKNNIGISIPIRSTSVNLKNLLNPRLRIQGQCGPWVLIETTYIITIQKHFEPVEK